MKRRRIFLAVALVLIALPFGSYARNALAQDSCLDSGGVWFGELGCLTEMPAVDRIVIDKSDRLLSAFSHGKLIRQMPVSLGREPVGPKQYEGDDKTPEGIYPITEHKADSSYHLALRLGYPTAQQTTKALLSHADPGGDIMIHGIRNGFGWLGTLQRRVDWTRGCIALTNGEIEWLYRSTNDGVPVELVA